MDGEAPYLEVKVLLEEPEPMLRQEIEEALAGTKYRLARIVSAYRQEERVEKEVDGWKRDCRKCLRCRLRNLHSKRFIRRKCLPT